jgi:hypothetical protein
LELRRCERERERERERCKPEEIGEEKDKCKKRERVK